jgi:hypothetical protein
VDADGGHPLKVTPTRLRSSGSSGCPTAAGSVTAAGTSSWDAV